MTSKLKMRKTIPGVDAHALMDLVTPAFNGDERVYEDGGQLCKQLCDDASMFCSLDHASEISSEYGNPEALAIRTEEELGAPLACCKSETRGTQ